MGGMGGGMASSMLGGGNAQPDSDSQPQAEIPIPLAALSQPDDQEQMQTPKQGDSVDFQVTATVSRIDGETAYVLPQAVNGQPLDDEEGEQAPDPDVQEESDLRQQAGQMSGQ